MTDKQSIEEFKQLYGMESSGVSEIIRCATYTNYLCIYLPGRVSVYLACKSILHKGKRKCAAGQYGRAQVQGFFFLFYSKLSRSRECSAAIHSDFPKAFMKAEHWTYDEFISSGGKRSTSTYFFPFCAHKPLADDRKTYLQTSRLRPR